MKKEKKTRLSSKRALEVLKFLVKKKLGAEEVDFAIQPTDCSSYAWCKILVNVTYDGDLGFTSFIGVAYRGYGVATLKAKRHTSWLQLLRRMEREANCPSKKAFFQLHGCNLFGPGDSIEKILVEIDLCC